MIRKALVLALVVSLGLAGAASGISGQFERNEDASGNGFDWDEVDPVDFDNVTAPVAKFGDGVKWNTSGAVDARWEETLGDDWVAETDLSIMVAMEVVHAADVVGFFVASDDGGGADDIYEIRMSKDGAVQFIYSDGGTEFPCEMGKKFDDAEFMSFWVRLDRGGPLTDTSVRLKTFDDGGNVVEDKTCTAATEPDSTESISVAKLFRDDLGSDTYKGAIYEFRWWNELIGVNALDVLADPTNPEFTGEEIGGESFLYFMEELVVGEASVRFQNRVAVHAPNLVEPGERFTLKAFAINASGFPVATTSDMELVITRVQEANGIEWLNVTSGTWASTVVSNSMMESLTSPFVWKLNVTVPTEDNVVMFATSTVDDEAGLEINVTGEHPLEVTDDVQLASHETELTTFTRLTALEMAWFVGAGVAGAWLWSRSNNPVVRAFGSALPMLSGALLLGYGADQGLGAVWAGTVPLAAGLFLLGGGMFAWMVWEWISQPDEPVEGGFM